jgi:hypothetical protein
MTKDYSQLVYNIIKPLALREDPVKIYRNVIDEDFNSRPRDFLVYSSGVSDSPRLYGDGKTLLRRCSCDITVNEGGDGNNDNAGYLVNEVEQLLIANNISYTKISLGYVESMDAMQTTFDFYLM